MLHRNAARTSPHLMRRTSVSCFILVLLAACGGKAEQPRRPPALVEVEAVATGQFSDTIEAVGTALANEQVVLAAPVTERITSINFADGGYVRRGQVIATLAQGQENAELAAAQAQAREAGQQLQRIQALRNKGFATGASLDAQVAAARAAQASAQQARASIGDRIIRAPFAGYVSLRTVSPGAIVSAGTEIATVSDISVIKLDFTVPETQLATLKQGQPIEARAAAYPDQPFRGTVATIDPVIDPNTRAVRVRAILPNPDKLLKPGMLLTVSVLAQQRRSLSVPELSVIGEGEERYVYLVAAGKAKRVPVRIGVRHDARVEILEGLKLGQKVVTEGIVKLSDGVPVRLPGQKGPPGSGSGAPGAAGRPASAG